MPALARLLSLFATLGVATAQSTWIVDRAGGPGVDFTDLPPALAAANAGDTVLVRGHATAYTAGIVTRGIRLVGQPTGGSGSFVRLAPGMVVRGIAANEHCAMQGFLCDNTSATALLVDACAGRVHLDSLQATTTTNNPGIVVQQCAAVSLRFCSANGNPALLIAGSRVAIAQCFLIGRGFGTQPPSPACTVDASVVDVAEGTWQGGAGNFAGPVPSAPALVASASTLTVTGGIGATFLTAGVSGAPPAGIVVGQSTLTIDPAVITGGVSGSGTVTTRRVPSVQATGGARNAPIVASVRTPPGDLIAFVIGLPGLPLTLPGLGTLWIDPAAILLTASTIQPPGSEIAGFPQVFVPPHVPVGTTLAYQALVGTGSDFRLSNPVVLVVR